MRAKKQLLLYLNMEKALYTLKYSRNNIADLLESREFPFDRIYYGDEGCENLLPSINELKKLLKKCSRSGVKITLVTPVLMSDNGIRK